MSFQSFKIIEGEFLHLLLTILRRNSTNKNPFQICSSTESGKKKKDTNEYKMVLKLAVSKKIVNISVIKCHAMKT
jgi:hypothetical protein